MKILLEAAPAELVVKNSRFRSEAAYVETPEAAREIWRLRKTQYDNGGLGHFGGRDQVAGIIAFGQDDLASHLFRFFANRFEKCCHFYLFLLLN